MQQAVTYDSSRSERPVEVVIPDHGAYTGAFMDFGDAEDDVTLETIEDFEEWWENIRPSSFRRATGENKIFLPAISTSFGGTARCLWYSGRLGTSLRGRSRPGQVQSD
jgi:hypothetical protein